MGRRGVGGQQGRMCVYGVAAGVAGRRVYSRVSTALMYAEGDSHTHDTHTEWGAHPEHSAAHSTPVRPHHATTYPDVPK